MQKKKTKENEREVRNQNDKAMCEIATIELTRTGLHSHI